MNTQNPPMSAMENLPIDAQYEILRWIDESNLEKVQAVCSLWNEIVDQWIGRIVFTSVPMIAHPNNPTSTKLGLELVSEIGVRSFHLDEKENLSELPPPPLPSFRRPLLLRSFVLHGKLHTDLFQNLVKNTVNLTRIEISLPALAQIGSQHMKHLNFPRLADLQVKSLSRDEGTSSTAALRTLLAENDFPRLKMLRMHIPVESYLDMETISLFVRFVNKHPLLTEVSVSVIFPLGYMPQEDTSYEEDLNEIIAGFKEEHSLIPVKTLRTEGNGVLWLGGPHLKILSHLGIDQDNLHEYAFGFAALPSDPIVKTFCSRIGSSMADSMIGYDYSSPLVVSNEIRFRGPESMRDIALWGADHFIGVQELTPNITRIFLIGGLTSDDVDHVLLHLPHLREALLGQVHRGREGYGARLDTLRQFVQNRRVHRLVLDIEGLEFPEEGISNGDPDSTVMLTTIGNGSTYLHWELKEDGYYNNAIE